MLCGDLDHMEFGFYKMVITLYNSEQISLLFLFRQIADIIRVGPERQKGLELDCVYGGGVQNIRFPFV